MHKPELDFVRSAIETYHTADRIWSAEHEIDGNKQRRETFRTIYRDYVQNHKPVYARNIPFCVRAVAQLIYPKKEEYFVDDDTASYSEPPLEDIPFSQPSNYSL
jgi:hypothetical protein